MSKGKTIKTKTKTATVRSGGKSAPPENGTADKSKKTNERKEVPTLNQKQRDALKQPVRFSIMSTIGVIEPASISDLAGQLNRTPHSLYYHVEILRQVGLIKEAGRRPGRTKPDVLYALAAKEYRLSGDSDEDFLSYARTAHRLSQQYLEEAHRKGYMTKVNNRYNANTLWNTRRLTPDQLEELYQHIIAIQKLTANKDNGDDHMDENADTSGDRYAILVSLAPLELPEQERE